MAYHLTILRSAKGLQQPIALEDATAAVRRVPGWRATAPATLDYSDSRGSVTLWHSDGELWTRLGEPWQIEPMLALARELGARVRGDEFETYATPQQTYSHPDDERLKRVALAQSAQLLAEHRAVQKRIRYYIWGTFAVLGALGYLLGKWFEGR